MESDSDDGGTSARGSSDGGGLAGGSDEVELDPTFTRQGRFPGTVKIVVESTTFWFVSFVSIYYSNLINLVQGSSRDTGLRIPFLRGCAER